MSKFLLTDAKVVVNGVDLSDHAFNVDTPQVKPQVDVSGFNPNATTEYLPGLADQTITVQFRQDFASGKVHSTLQGLYAGGSVFVVYVQPTSGTVSATNPAFGGSATMYDYNGLAGALNASSDMTVNFKPAPGSRFAWAATVPS
jgi:hypothetical protein